MDLDHHALDYLAQARWHYFRFQLGSMDGLDRERQMVMIASTMDDEGRELIPRREIQYDTLVIAVGSHTNDFGTPGAREHAISLDTAEQAELFHRRLVNACIRANAQVAPLRAEQLHVAIIGAGATGVELAAELHRTARELVAYGFDQIDPERDIKLTLIAAGSRILPALPERLSKATEELLRGLNVQVLTGEPDGRAAWRHDIHRRPVRPFHVCVALPDAPARAAWLCQDAVRYGCAHDHPPHRAEGEVALNDECGMKNDECRVWMMRASRSARVL
jgi:NADPH-dependent 2,4-dienoyl-CoA reductase/sulfur reductase-like enzyme